MLQVLNMSHNALTSKLPSVWGAASAFPGMQSLALQGCQLRGPLTKQWGSQGGWLQLAVLQLDNNSLSGFLPIEWSSDPAFPAMQARRWRHPAVWSQPGLLVLARVRGRCRPVA